MEGDIRDAAHVEEVVAGVDVIVNAAAESHVEKSILDGASEFVTTNVEGTQVLLDAFAATRSSVHPGVVERGLRHGRERPDGRGPPAQPALP